MFKDLSSTNNLKMIIKQQKCNSQACETIDNRNGIKKRKTTTAKLFKGKTCRKCISPVQTEFEMNR